MNIKSFFSTPGKKALGIIALLVVAVSAVGGTYRLSTGESLLGNLQVVFQQQTLDPIVINPNQVQVQPNQQMGVIEQQPLQVSPGDIATSTINVIPSGNIQGLPIDNKNKVSVWLAAGQGMKHDNGKLVEWQDLSGNGRHVIAGSNHAPQVAKQSGADCGDFNCQYSAFFDGFNDYMKSVKKIDNAREMFVVVDLGNKIFVDQGDKPMPVLNFDNTGTFNVDDQPYDLPNGWKENENMPRSGVNLRYNQNNSKFTASLDSYYITGCVPDEEDPEAGYGCVHHNFVSTISNQTSQSSLQHPILLYFKEGRVFVNGKEINPVLSDYGSFTALTNENFYLGARGEGDPFGRFFNGKIGEVIILNDEISDSERQKIDSYLTTKFGISKGDAFPMPFNGPGSQIYNLPSQVGLISGGYANGIFGAGRLDSIGLRVGIGSNNFSKSTFPKKFFSIGQTVGFDNGEFVYAGHSNKNNGSNWSSEYTEEEAQLLTERWQISGAIKNNEGGNDSFVMSAKLASNVASELKVAEPAANQDFAIAFFNNEIFTGSAQYFVLRDDGQNGDLVANDNIYSTRIERENIVNEKYFTLARGPKGMFPDPSDDEGSEGSGEGGEGGGGGGFETPNDFAPVPQEPEPGDNAFDLHVRTENEQGQSLTRKIDYSNDNTGFVATPQIFINQSLAGNKTITFEAVQGFVTPGTVTIQGNKINAPLPANVKIYKNQIGVNYSAGSILTENDTLIVVGVYKTSEQPPVVEEDDDTVAFRILTEDDKGNTLNEGYSYNGEPYKKTPDVFNKKYSDFVNQTTQIKKIAFAPKAGYITPGELTITNGVISTLPKNVKVFLNGPNNPYPLGSQFKVGDSIMVVGVYVKSATITVGVDGPDDLPEVEVDIPGVEEDVPIPNGEEEVFEVDPDGNYEVICPQIPGYTLVTQPHPIVINNLEPGENQDAVCKYEKTDAGEATIKVSVEGPNGLNEAEVDITPGIANNVSINNNSSKTFQVEAGKNYTVTCEENPQGFKLVSKNPTQLNNVGEGDTINVNCIYVKDGDTTITVEVDGPKSLDEAEVEIPGITSGTDIDNGDTKTFVVDPNKNYTVFCEEIEGYILVTNPHPIPVSPLSPGANKKVTCEYVTDTDAPPYNGPPTLGDEMPCLSYEERDLDFTDLSPNQLGAAEAQILKNTYFSTKSPNEKIENLKKYYPLSGYGSNLTGGNQKKAQVGLPNRATRMEVTLLTMQLHCLPIFRADTLPAKRLDGKPMPVFIDRPERHTVADDVIMSAAFYGILEGYNYLGHFRPLEPNPVRWNNPISREEFVKVVNNAGQTWQGYQFVSDFNLARRYGITEREWSFTFYARALKEKYPNSAILQTPSLLTNIQQYISRGEMVKHLFHSVIRRGLYFPKDQQEAWDAYQELID